MLPAEAHSDDSYEVLPGLPAGRDAPESPPVTIGELRAWVASVEEAEKPVAVVGFFFTRAVAHVLRPDDRAVCGIQRFATGVHALPIRYKLGERVYRCRTCADRVPDEVWTADFTPPPMMAMASEGCLDCGGVDCPGVDGGKDACVGRGVKR